MTKLNLGKWNADLRSRQILNWIWETWVWIAVFLPIQSRKRQSSWKDSEVGARELTAFVLLPLGREVRHSKLDVCGGCESIRSTDFRDDSKQAFDFWNSILSLSLSLSLYFPLQYYFLQSLATSPLMFKVIIACSRYAHSFAHSQSYSLLLFPWFNIILERIYCIFGIGDWSYYSASSSTILSLLSSFQLSIP